MFVRFSSKVTPPACPVPSEKIKTFFGMIAIFCGGGIFLKGRVVGCEGEPQS
jgi:hypothetical protein